MSLSAISFAADRQPPKTRADGVEDTLHGIKVADPYRWLEDQNSTETRAWIAGQNQYTRSFLDEVPGRADLEKRFSELMRVDVVGMPVERGGRYFFTKRRADQDLPVLYMRKGRSGADEVLIDPHPLSADHTTSVNLLEVSDDGTLIAYAIRKGGEDEFEIRFLNVDTRQELPDRMPRARYYGVSLTPDKKTLYYSRHFDEGSRIYQHPMGTDPAQDRRIFGDGYGPDKGIGAGVSENGRWLLLSVFYGSNATQTEIWAQDLAKGGPIKPVVKDIASRFSGEAAGDTLYVQTNWKAPKGRVLAIDLNDPAQQRWREVVPESAASLEDLTLAGGKLCANYLENVVSKVVVFDTRGARLREISFPALGSVSGVYGRWETDEAFFAFSSFHIPTTIYRYGLAKGEREVWSQVKVPVQSEDFELKQVWCKSKDGTRVPMFVLHRKGLKLDGSAPAYLTAYGGFNASMTPGFSASAVLWAERGGVFAVPNLRGGGEFGEAWHQAGMMERKQNVFDDFFASAEYLVENGYTRPARLAIAGGSNGGLLVGAAMTQRPELFGAVICRYPLLDMVRYHQFMLARFWVSEYGSSEDPAQFKTLYAYSPYHRVKPGTKYPSVLFVTGDNDTRVAPLHARKMAAMVQAATASGPEKPVLLLYDTASGHSGGRPLKKQIEVAVDEFSYLLRQLQ